MKLNITKKTVFRTLTIGLITLLGLIAIIDAIIKVKNY